MLYDIGKSQNEVYIVELFVNVYENGTRERESAEKVMRYIGANIKELYVNDNLFNPYLLWDGRFTTLELFTIGEELKGFHGYENVWIKLKSNIKKLEEEGKYAAIFRMISKRMTFSVFKLYMHSIPEDQAYKIFKNIYSSAEYNFDILNWEDIEELCQRQNQLDIQLLRERFGEEITIYRGETNKSNKEGYSWTTSYDIAAWFAHRFNGNGRVLKGKVNVNEVLTYIDSKESEVLVPRGLIDQISEYNPA
ncbi:hypothetical protein BVAD3_41380 (plasmid) [Bacillus velezensis]|nr:hypothetical protein BVAD3_41380 [Bacillus velezensis]